MFSCLVLLFIILIYSLILLLFDPSLHCCMLLQPFQTMAWLCPRGSRAVAHDDLTRDIDQWYTFFCKPGPSLLQAPSFLQLHSGDAHLDFVWRWPQFPHQKANGESTLLSDRRRRPGRSEGTPKLVNRPRLRVHKISVLWKGMDLAALNCIVWAMQGWFFEDTSVRIWVPSREMEARNVRPANKSRQRRLWSGL